MLKKGFTIIELLIVIAIISILVGVAVPYYNDYITDARLSVLKQNAATFRNSLNQFRGDNLRGPFAVSVYKGGTLLHANPLSGAADGSELVSGPIQIINNAPTRRQNIKYIPAMPVFTDPFSGGNITPPDIEVSEPSAYFYDSNANGRFDFDIDGNSDMSDSEFAFLNGDSNTEFNTTYDTILFFDTRTAAAVYVQPFDPTLARTPLDFTQVKIKDSSGNAH